MPTLNHTGTLSWQGNSPGALSIAATANDIIVIVFAAEVKVAAAVPAVSGMSATGLTFTNRSAFAGSGQGNSNNEGTRSEMWWAVAASTTTYSVTISITGGGQTIDDGAAVALAVSGCNTSSPWDPSVTLPVNSVNSTGTTANPSASFTLSASSAFVIANLNTFNNVPAGGVEGPSTGWTNAAHVENGGGTLFAYNYVVYRTDLAAGSYSGVTPFTTAASSDIFVLDALAASSTPAYPPQAPRGTIVPQTRASNWRGWTKTLTGLVVPPFSDDRLLTAGV